jgi:hypothetical protein
VDVQLDLRVRRGRHEPRRYQPLDRRPAAPFSAFPRNGKLD